MGNEEQAKATCKRGINGDAFRCMYATRRREENDI
jgi:hypothetical protein